MGPRLFYASYSSNSLLFDYIYPLENDQNFWYLTVQLADRHHCASVHICLVHKQLFFKS